MSDGPRIADYAYLSDRRTAALVSGDGSIDWYCPPRFDAPSIFGRLLDPEAGHWRIGPVGEARSRRAYLEDSLVLRTELETDDGAIALTNALVVDPEAGHWRIGPVGEARSRRAYLEDSLVLRTELETDDGAIALTDALVVDPDARGHEVGLDVPHLLVRRVEGLRGRVEVELDLVPRFEYGLTRPHIEPTASGVEMSGGAAVVRFRAPMAVESDGDRVGARFAVAEGDRLTFGLAFASLRDAEPVVPDDLDALLDATAEAWRSLVESHRGYTGRWADAVRRSSVLLHGLTYAPTGGIVAAATTSLPEIVGGEANWDYRFVWLRDLTLTIRALATTTCETEIVEMLRLIAVGLGRIDPASHVQIMLRATGERILTEQRLEHLAGFRDSRPVRAGNAAWAQRQLDVTGEVIDAASTLGDRIGAVDPLVRELVVQMADSAAANKDEPDAGMWEARDRQRHYVSSKVMRWVALDRAVRLARHLGDGANPEAWASARDELRAEILDRGWHDRAGAYTGAYGSDHLDASVLLLPIVGFLPATDERMAATIHAIRERLSDGPHVRRWRDDPNSFLICGYWMAECEALLGETDAAVRRFEALTALANDVGILSEMADIESGELIGNVPQAFSHVGLINAAARISELLPSEA